MLNCCLCYAIFYTEIDIFTITFSVVFTSLGIFLNVLESLGKGIPYSFKCANNVSTQFLVQLYSADHEDKFSFNFDNLNYIEFLKTITTAITTYNLTSMTLAS